MNGEANHCDKKVYFMEAPVFDCASGFRAAAGDLEI
jgi:hypothetical protein